MEGVLLNGRFRLLEVLGAGGMGTVWRAWDEALHRFVAIKALVGAGRGDRSEALVARFLREGQLAARLTSPHIVTVYDSDRAEVDGRTVLFIVMEEVRGRSLEQVASGAGGLHLRDVARWGQEICSALEVAHAAGVVHRDLKPSNVMVDEDGRAVVLDFGIARLVEGMTKLVTLTPTGYPPGTPAYMSPEQARGDRDLDGRSDLYALGCVLYRLLTGVTPFGTGPWHVVLNGHLDVAPVPPSEHRPGLPAEWTTLVLDLLAKASSDRPGSAAAVRERLAVLPLRAVASTPSGPVVASPPDTDPTLPGNGSTVAALRELPGQVPRVRRRTWTYVPELVGALNLGAGAGVAAGLAADDVTVGGFGTDIPWIAVLVGAAVGGMLGHACARFLQVRYRIFNWANHTYLNARHPVDPTAVIWAAGTKRYRCCRWALSEKEDGWALVHHHGRSSYKASLVRSANGVVVESEVKTGQRARERWRVVAADSGHVSLVDLVDRKTFQVAPGNPDLGYVVKEPLDGSHRQQWRLLPVEGVDVWTGSARADRVVAAVLGNDEGGLVGSTLLGILAVEHLAVLSIARPGNVLGWVVTEILIFVPDLVAAATVANLTLDAEVLPPDGSIRVTTLATGALVAVVSALSLSLHGASELRVMVTTPLVWVGATLSAIVLTYVTWPFAALLRHLTTRHGRRRSSGGGA